MKRWIRGAKKLRISSHGRVVGEWSPNFAIPTQFPTYIRGALEVRLVLSYHRLILDHMSIEPILLINESVHFNIFREPVADKKRSMKIGGAILDDLLIQQ